MHSSAEGSGSPSTTCTGAHLGGSAPQGQPAAPAPPHIWQAAVSDAAADASSRSSGGQQQQGEREQEGGSGRSGAGEDDSERVTGLAASGSFAVWAREAARDERERTFEIQLPTLSSERPAALGGYEQQQQQRQQQLEADDPPSPLRRISRRGMFGSLAVRRELRVQAAALAAAAAAGAGGGGVGGGGAEGEREDDGMRYYLMEEGRSGQGAAVRARADPRARRPSLLPGILRGGISRPRAPRHLRDAEEGSSGGRSRAGGSQASAGRGGGGDGGLSLLSQRSARQRSRRRSSLSFSVMVIDMGVHELSNLSQPVNLIQVRI